MKALSMFKQLTCLVFILGLTVSLMNSCEPKKQKTTTDIDDPVTIADSAFTYGLPIVLMDITRRQQAIKAANKFFFMRSFPTPADTGVVAPNADTYYCIAWGDFKDGPLVFHMPDPKGRYYVMPFLDAYSNVFESISPRTDFSAGGTFFIARDTFKGEVPKGMTHIKCPTSFFWILGRIQCNGGIEDSRAVWKIQDAMQLKPFFNTGLSPIPVTNVPSGSPNDIVQNMKTTEFLNYLNKLLTENPPPQADTPSLNLFKKIRVGPGENFDPNLFPKLSQPPFDTIPKMKYTQIYTYASQPPTLTRTGWNVKTTGIGTYGTNYWNRAVVAVTGLGCNLPQDAVYPTCYIDNNGKPFDGSKYNYTLTFHVKKDTPPVKGFWSLTMYNQKGFFVSNVDSTYAIGHGPAFKYGTDGSLTLLIQNAPPEDKSMINNWLPAPNDAFNLMMRLYYPNPNDPSILNGNWTPPKVECTNCPVK